MADLRENIEKAVILLAANPKLLLKAMTVRIKGIVPLPKSPVQKGIDGVLFEFDFAYDPLVRKMYVGGYEIGTIDVMKRVLKKGTVFIDVGASIGYLSAIGAGLVGATGQVHSFELVPQHFLRLTKLAMMNPDYNIVVNECALGEERGMARISVTRLENIGWNTMVPGFMPSDTVKVTLEVPVHRLDSYIKEEGLRNISLIKIDTEGFEFPVLKGLRNYFESTSHRPAIICEIAASAYPLLGCTPDELSEYMRTYGYNAYSVFDTSAEVEISSLDIATNVVFISSR